MDSNGEGKQSPSAAENIRTLSKIGARVPRILQDAGSAASLLTNSSRATQEMQQSDDDEAMEDVSNGLNARKAAFSKLVRDCYTSLRAVQQELEGQVNALEDAGIIPSSVPKDHDALAAVTNNGMGNLDVGWLNSRSRDVGLEKEQELVKEGREWLDSTKKRTEEEKDTTMKDAE